MPKILVVEDDELLRDALTAQLSVAGHQVESVGDGRAAQLVLSQATPDAVVLDLGLPGLDGLQVLDWIRLREPALPVLIVTARDGIEDRVVGLQRGADDYLTKPFDMNELQARVASLLRRSKLPAFAVKEAEAVTELLRVDSASPRAWINGQATDLTQREWELLGLLLAERGKVVSREDVLAVWQTDVAEPLQSNALEVYIHRLRRKLDSSDWVIRNVRGLGYMLERDLRAT